MAMEPVPTHQPSAFASSFGAGQPRPDKTKGKGKGKGKGKFATKRTPRDPSGGRYTPKLLGKAYFQRKKGCPFSGPKAPKIDYKDVRLLTKYVSDYGKILPRHLTGVCALKQRELATAIKRARMLALMGYTGRGEHDAPRRSFGDRGPREGAHREGRERTDRAPREPRHDAAPVAAAAE